LELNLDHELVSRIKNLRMIIFDVDGVMTDGTIYYSDAGIEIKGFDVKDGHGMKLLLRAGIELGIITGRYSKTVELRAQEIGIRYVYQNAKVKLDAYQKILEATGFSDEEMGYVGDDLIDIPVMKRVGWAVAVADASPHILPFAHYVTKRPGGRGACREVCEMVLQVKGLWEKVTNRYFLKSGEVGG